MVLQRLDVTSAVVDRAVLTPASLLLDEDGIVAVGLPSEVGDIDVPTTSHRGTLVPGFVDLQVNGFAGHQYGGRPGSLAATSAALLSTGVTSIAPTITSRAWERYEADLATMAPVSGAPAPRHLGLHLEGPFLAADQAGAHDRAVLVAPTIERVEQLLAWSPCPVGIVTLAPELPGAPEAIRRLRDAGVVVSAGHTDATYAQLQAAVEQGLSMVTHVFNAQRGLGHREPGVAGGALLLGELTVGVILDGHHLHPDLAAMVLEVAAGRVIAVTDAVATAGLPLGRHEFDGIEVDTSDGAPRLEDGTLAGSSLTMDAAFRFVAGARGLVAAVEATATTPARALGRDEVGHLARGAVADLVLLDADLAVAAVWSVGQQVSVT